MRKQLLAPILDGGIRNINFFDGRLLIADDLKAEQRAIDERFQRLGHAIGDGVVKGLAVSMASDGSGKTGPALVVSAGIAINRNGQILELAQNAVIDLPFAKISDARPVAGPIKKSGLFTGCEPSDGPGGVRFEGSRFSPGAYILLISPAFGFADQTLKICSPDDGKQSGRGRRYRVEGVRFRLVQLDPNRIPPADLSDAAECSRLRNLLAYLFFGVAEVAAFFCYPFARTDGDSGYKEYGLMDELRRTDAVLDEEVPLALVYCTTTGIKFVDMWAVRRLPTPYNGGGLWPLQVGQRRLREAEAMFMQFQAHIDDLGQQTDLSKVVATDFFCYLPSAGYLPLGAGEFRRDTFFQDLPVVRSRMDDAFQRLLIHHSFYLEPIPLSVPDEKPGCDTPPDQTPLRIRVYDPENCCCKYVLFTRAEKCLEGLCEPDTGEPLQEGEPRVPCPGKVTKCQLNIDVVLDDMDDLKALCKCTLEDGVDIVVCAADEVGNVYPARFLQVGGDLQFGAGKTVTFDKGSARFVTDPLPAGCYTVKVETKGFKSTARIVDDPCEQNCISFKLVAEVRKSIGKLARPRGGVTGSWINPGWYDKIYMIDSCLDWPWRPLEDPPPYERIEDPPPEIAEEIDIWQQEWSEWFVCENPKAPLNPGDIRIYTNPQHTPCEVSDGPYAHIVFGEGSAYVPLVLIPYNFSLGCSISVAEAGITGITPAFVRQLESANLGKLDVLASSWTHVISDAISVDSKTAHYLIKEARSKVLEIKGTLRGINGIDEATAERLKTGGLESPYDIANADVGTLQEFVGSKLIASWLLREARKLVGKSAYLFETYGLKSEEINRLTEVTGFTTPGALAKVVTANPLLKESVAEALGLDLAGVDRLIDRINITKNEVSLNFVALDAPDGIPGIDESTAIRLARRDLGTTLKVATADVGNIAEVAEVDLRSADEIMLIAASRILKVDNVVMRRLVASNITLATLPEADPDTVKEALSGTVDENKLDAEASRLITTAGVALRSGSV